MEFRTAEREHEFCYGHSVTGHEGRCRNLHGHQGKVLFVVEAPSLDDVGRVIDFSVIKEKLCNWLEENWDHRFLIWDQDPRCHALANIDPTVMWVPFNPTAENLAEYLVKTVGPVQLVGTGCRLISVTFHETTKCAASFSLDMGEE